MSYSICFKCYQMVGSYDKYCKECQKRHKLPDLPNYQKENSIPEGKDFDEWTRDELKKDFGLTQLRKEEK